MQQVLPAWTRPPGWAPLVPTPGPLGRLVARRRTELGLTQQELADATAKHGVPISQNGISRLESGKTQRINDPARLASLGKALGLESNAEFVISAYAPNAERLLPSMEMLPPGPDGEIVALVRRIPSARKQYAIDFLRMIAKALALVLLWRDQTLGDQSGRSRRWRTAALP